MTRIVSEVPAGARLRCRCCDRDKPTDGFRIQAPRRDNGAPATYRSWCIECQGVWNAKRRLVDGRLVAPTIREVRVAVLGGAQAARVLRRTTKKSSRRDRLDRDPEVEAALGMLRDARAQRRGEQGYVYCIGENRNTAGVPMVKVGYSVNPEARVGELQTGNPRQLHLLGKREGTVEDEAALHARYAHLHVLGEWFRLTASLRSEFE